jgi:RNA polymerase sigma factor (TIGR02999 family)
MLCAERDVAWQADPVGGAAMGQAQEARQTGQASGLAGASAALFPVVYDELRRMARQQLRHERDGHTLATTDLVHEAWLRLGSAPDGAAMERAQFFAIASAAMRHVLIDHARRHQALRRGGGARAVTLDEAQIAATESSAELVALDDALSRLAELDERLARVVECRYFGGLTEDETARALGVTARTVRRDWVKAKAWLYRELNASRA